MYVCIFSMFEIQQDSTAYKGPPSHPHSLLLIPLEIHIMHFLNTAVQHN